MRGTTYKGQAPAIYVSPPSTMINENERFGSVRSLQMAMHTSTRTLYVMQLRTELYDATNTRLALWLQGLRRAPGLPAVVQFECFGPPTDDEGNTYLWPQETQLFRMCHYFWLDHATHTDSASRVRGIEHALQMRSYPLEERRVRHLQTTGRLGGIGDAAPLCARVD